MDVKTIQLFSINGVILKTIRNYTCGQTISVNDLAKGVYILKIYSLKNEISFEKLFIKM